MFRKIYSIILVVTVFISRHSLDAEETNQAELHRSIPVDTKYWLGNTEFANRINWRNERKPCTLLERVRLDEQSVVSIGDSMDAFGSSIESGIRDLCLAETGMLLLEENALAGREDPTFVSYLNGSGDCIDDENGESLFAFKPNGDALSWFNPDNWASESMDEEVALWLPDSHRIPCSEDVVVFGASPKPIADSSNNSYTHSFKVNFESNWRISRQPDEVNLGRIDNIRVSKLKIGTQQYNQGDFERLVSSYEYRDILFNFNSSSSLLAFDDGVESPIRSPLIIDESALQTGTDYELCLDEAGCMCGNEATIVMKAICSFTQTIEEADLPCYDPVSSTGYCGKICASVITISMDPTKFNEKFVLSLLDSLMSSDGTNYFSANVFTGSRRTYDNKYEITFRHVPSERSYESTLNREEEFARLVYNHLDRAAEKSFYGIKSINLRVSAHWRRSNRALVFWTLLTVFSFIAVATFIRQEGLSKFPSLHIQFVYRRVLQSRASTLRAQGESKESDSNTECLDSSTVQHPYEPSMVTPTESFVIDSVPLIRLDSR